MSRSRRFAVTCGIVASVISAGLWCGWRVTREELQPGGMPFAYGQPTESWMFAPGPVVGEEQSDEDPYPAEQAPVINSSDTPVSSVIRNHNLQELIAISLEQPDNLSELLKLFPALPPDEQAEAAQYLSYLLPKENFDAIGKYLTELDTPELLRDVIMSALLNRSDNLRLPYLLAVAQDGRNPGATEAKSLLEAILDENHGDDWLQWQANLERWLRSTEF